MNRAEAEALFGQLGQALLKEPDRAKRDDFLRKLREDPRMSEGFLRAVAALRGNLRTGLTYKHVSGFLEKAEKSESEEVEPFVSDMNGIVRFLGGGEDTEATPVLYTHYGAGVYEFMAGERRVFIAPLRTSDLRADFDDAEFNIARRAFDVGSSSVNFFPFFAPETVLEGEQPALYYFNPNDVTMIDAISIAASDSM